jgi:hypothetical protein
MTLQVAKQFKSLPTIVSLRKDKKLQELKIVVQEWKDHSVILTTHGIQGSETPQVDRQAINEGKNLGKANQTTHWEQACLEAESKWNSKIREGYYDPTKDNPNVVKLPMLAHSYADRKKVAEASTSCFLQLKLNGVRCTWQNGEFYSRKGQSYNHRLPFLSTFAETIAKYLKKVNGFDPKKGHFFDGELICDGISLQELAGYMNRKSNFDYGDPDDYKIFNSIRYVIYDIYMPDKTFEERFLSIDEGFKRASLLDSLESYENYFMKPSMSIYLSSCRVPVYTSPFNPVKPGSIEGLHPGNKVGFLKTYSLKYDSVKTLDTLIQKAWTVCSYAWRHVTANVNSVAHYSEPEGFIIRTNTFYELNTRTTSLLKYKQFKDAEFTIESLTTPKTGRDEGCAIYVCKTDKDLKFNAPPVGSQEERRATYNDYLANPNNYVGKPLVVQFADLTPDGVPQFPKALRIRLED